MPKRVITGQHADGGSYFARVDELDQDFRGIGSFRVWAVDELGGLRLPFLEQAVPLAAKPSAEETPEALRTVVPQPRRQGEFRLSLHRMAPGPDGGADARPYLHWHDTFDLQWLIAGELTITLDSGDAATLKPGDVVVQHGTNHAWRAGPEGATLAIFMHGAKRVGVAPPKENWLDAGRWEGAAASAPAEPAAVEWAWEDVDDMLERTPRRIVTAQREDGVSVLLRVEEAEEDARTTARGRDGGVLVHRLWANDALLPIELPFLGADAQPTPAESGEALRTSSPHAGPGGLRVSLIKFLPREHGREYGLHWHDTVDVQWVFAGELTIGLDDGSEVTMHAGDVVVQHGTNHSWRVGPQGAVVGLAMLGVERDGAAPPADTFTDQTPAGVAARAEVA